MKVLAERVWCIVASPTLLEKHGGVTVLADLNRLPTLDLGPAQSEHVWHLDGPDGAKAELHHIPRLVTDDMTMLRMAAVAGAGLVQLPTMMVTEELHRGQLVKLVPDWVPKGGMVHVVFPSRRGLLPSVRKLIDYLSFRFTQLQED